jgi:signal transduction histidine kinase
MVGTVVDVSDRKIAEEAEAAAQSKQAAQEERSRLARDLHDSVTQALFAATMKAEALTLATDSLSTESVKAIEDVWRLNRGALAQMRTLLLELRGDPLEEVPLQQLLRQLAEAAEARSSANVLLTIREGEKLPAELHVAVYRITQEALTNVTRHARASEAWVDLDVQPDAVRLRIRDDGCGFDPSTVGAAHLGLKSMRERAARAGAELEILSKQDEGTVVTLDWRAKATAT